MHTDKSLCFMFVFSLSILITKHFGAVYIIGPFNRYCKRNIDSRPPACRTPQPGTFSLTTPSGLRYPNAVRGPWRGMNRITRQGGMK